MNQTFIWLESILFTVAVVLYLLSTILYFVSFVSKKEKLAHWGSIGVKIGFLVHSVAILSRGLGSGRFPLANQYEFATAFAWGIALIFLLFERKYPNRTMGTFVTPLLFLIIGYAAMQNREVRPLMPALQSSWLAIHVSFAVIGYGSFAVACGVSIMYLVKQAQKQSSSLDLPPEEHLDEISYKAIQLGYLFLTLCIITGAIWAQYSWGRYWAWDPKETWSLVTWIIYTILLVKMSSVSVIISSFITSVSQF